MSADPPASPGTPEPPDEGFVQVETDQQLHAIGSLMRHRVLRVLRDGPATVTQIAARLEIAKGSSNYHVKVLAKAGLIKVVDTRKVRGVTELYYGMAGQGIQLPDRVPGQPEILMRHALADIEGAPGGAEREVRLKHLRLSPENFALAVAKVTALYDELATLHDPEQQAADFFSALYRPLDSRTQPSPQPSSQPSSQPSPQPSSASENGTPAR